MVSGRVEDQQGGHQGLQGFFRQSERSGNELADRLAKEALGIEEAGGAPVRKGSDRRRKQK